MCACLDDTILQKWKGHFLNPLVIKMFAAHFIASKGAKEILRLNDSSEATPAACGALGMAATAVCIIY